MVKVYEIARYLTPEVKQAILSHRYVVSGQPTGEELHGEPVIYHGALPVSVDDGYCPLAYVPGVDEQRSAPTAFVVALAVNRLIDRDEPDHDSSCESGANADIALRDADCRCYDRLLERLEVFAGEFICDWDQGRISPEQLPAALGMTA